LSGDLKECLVSQLPQQPTLRCLTVGHNARQFCNARSGSPPACSTLFGTLVVHFCFIPLCKSLAPCSIRRYTRGSSGIWYGRWLLCWSFAIKAPGERLERHDKDTSREDLIESGGGIGPIMAIRILRFTQLHCHPVCCLCVHDVTATLSSRGTTNPHQTPFRELGHRYILKPLIKLSRALEIGAR
jgi:hypothetical protein